MGDLLSGVREAAHQILARNALALNDTPGGGPMSLQDRAQRFWDLPAKYQLARQIEAEELRRDPVSHNDAGDAMRHARASQRLAAGAGAGFAALAGLGHEAGNIADAARQSFEHWRGAPGPAAPFSQTMDEVWMDLHNNAEGRRAAIERRSIDPANLQTFPSAPPAAILYRTPPPRREGDPPR